MKRLDRAVETVVGLLLVALVATAFGQVVARYVFSRPFTWVLETGIVLMVWATFLTGYLGVRRNSHLRVDYVLERLRPRARRRAVLLARCLAIAFAAVVGVKSLDIIEAMEGIAFTSIPLPMTLLYWSLPVGSALMLVALVDALARDARRRDD